MMYPGKSETYASTLPSGTFAHAGELDALFPGSLGHVQSLHESSRRGLEERRAWTKTLVDLIGPTGTTPLENLYNTRSRALLTTRASYGHLSFRSEDDVKIVMWYTWNMKVPWNDVIERATPGRVDIQLNGVEGKLMRESVTRPWIENDKTIPMNDRLMAAVIDANYDDPDVKEMVTSLVSTEDPVFTGWMMESHVSYKELGDVLSGILLDMERNVKNQKQTDAIISKVLQNKKSIDFLPLLKSKSKTIRDRVMNSLVSSFSDRYVMKPATPETRDEMVSLFMTMLKDPNTGEAVATHLKERGLFKLKVSNKEVYCNFMKSLKERLERDGHPSRNDVIVWIGQDCK